jgi:2-oxoglutarate ferredoxin oxidoreductase subunit gamma
MQHAIVLSGFGGQGALFAGQLLAHAAMAAGREVTWIPSYGPEMRGGTAHCTVVVSDQPIGSPLVGRPSMVVALNNPSAERYEALVQPGGLLVYNASLVTHSITRRDIRVLAVRGSEIAAGLGNPRLLNMVLVGALVAASGLLPMGGVIAALREHLPAQHRDLLELNEAALRRGAATARSSPAAA